MTKDKELIEKIIKETLVSDVGMSELEPSDADKLKLELFFGKTETFEKIISAFTRQALNKALSSANKQIKNLVKRNKEQARYILDVAILEKEITELKHQLQKKDDIIKGMNQIIQKKTLTKEQVFGKDKLQTAEKEGNKL